ncbi:hypothetical protein [Streptomyces sp. NPDC059874]|uniref:hypothetical protein n=1 Tax=Streptomyces sp. NPDC059874 TaxID=3346983 RepID=UPI003659C4B4
MTYWRNRTSAVRHRHFGDTLALVATAVVILSALVTYRTGFALVALLIGDVLLTCSIVMQLRHRYGPPCVECVKQMPLNPAESAREDRSARWGLRAFHSATDSLPRVLLGCIALLGCMVLTCVSLYRVIAMGGAVGSATPFLGLGLALTAVGEWMIRTHNRLAPWCPYCDDGDEDDDESPVDDPTDGRGRPVPA